MTKFDYGHVSALSGILGVKGYGMPMAFGYGDMSASISFVNGGINIHRHMDWSETVGDYWQGIDYSGGTVNYRGGSYDLDLFITPWSFTTTTNATQYQGWNSWVSGPNFYSGSSHHESHQQIESHSVSKGSFVDSFLLRDDTLDFSSFTANGQSQVSSYETHSLVAGTQWQNPWEQGESNQQSFSSHLLQQSSSPGYSSQHVEDMSYNVSDTIVVGHTPQPYFDKGFMGDYLLG